MSKIRIPFRWLMLGYGVLFLLVVVQADRRALPGFVYRVYGGMPAGDLIGHVLLFGGASFVLHGMQGGSLVGRYGRRIPQATPWLVILATVEELSQAFFPTRTLSPVDLMANYLGIAAGGMLAQPWAGPYRLRLTWRRIRRATWELGPLAIPLLRVRRRRSREAMAA